MSPNIKFAYEDLERLKELIRKKDHAKVKSMLRLMDSHMINYRFQESGPQKLYPDSHSYYLLHIVIETQDMSMLKLFKEFKANPDVSYTVESNFNSRADSYMDSTSYNLVQWSKRCFAGREQNDFLEAWLLENKNHQS
jgi:hypothetical protein